MEKALALTNNFLLLVHSEEDAMWIRYCLFVAILDELVVFVCNLLML